MMIWKISMRIIMMILTDMKMQRTIGMITMNNAQKKHFKPQN
jgi:hypothetical protein